MEPLQGDHQCGPHCLRACTLDVRPEFVQGLAPEATEGYLVEERGGLRFVGDMNYVNVLNLGYWNQGGVWIRQGRNGCQEPEKPAEEPAEESAEEPGLAVAVVQPEQRENPPRRRRQNRKFTALQLRELESFFQESEYPDLLTRREIARHLGVTDTRVQIWFKNRRARSRRHERAAVIQGPAPAAMRRF